MCIISPPLRRHGQKSLYNRDSVFLHEGKNHQVFNIRWSTSQTLSRRLTFLRHQSLWAFSPNCNQFIITMSPTFKPRSCNWCIYDCTLWILVQEITHYWYARWRFLDCLSKCMQQGVRCCYCPRTSNLNNSITFLHRFSPKLKWGQALESFENFCHHFHP